MKLLSIVLLLGLALAGCQAGNQAADSSTDAVAAEAPNLILEFSDQTKVYECSECGMVFDGPGECSMKDGVLEAKMVTYKCPEDGETFEKAGTCPTHDVLILAHLTPFVAEGETHDDHEGHDHDAEGTSG